MTNKKLPKLNRAEKTKLQDCLQQSCGLDEATYAIIDSAKDSSIPFFLSGLKANFCSLFKADKASSLASVAPYIVELKESSNTVNWYLEKLYGHGVGFVIKSSATLQELTHFWADKVFTEMPSSKTKGYFRFYDPRVLRKYLVLLSEEKQLSEFLGHASTLLVEDESPQSALKYSRKSDNRDKFRVETINLADPVEQSV